MAAGVVVGVDSCSHPHSSFALAAEEWLVSLSFALAAAVAGVVGVDSCSAAAILVPHSHWQWRAAGVIAIRAGSNSGRQLQLLSLHQKWFDVTRRVLPLLVRATVGSEAEASRK